MKTFVEETEIESTAQVVSRDQKHRENVVREIRVPQRPRHESAGAQSKTDVYESCLDIAATFLPRG